MTRNNDTWEPTPAQIRSIAIGIAVLLAVVGIGLFLYSGFHTVGPHEQALVFQSNGEMRTLGPGMLQWVTPFFNTVTKYDTRNVLFTQTAVGTSLDLQETTTEVSVLYAPSPAHIQEIHRHLGLEYGAKIVVPAVQGCVKNAVSFYDVEQLRGAIRVRVTEDIEACIKAELANGFLIAPAVTVTDFDFSEEVNRAIEQAAIAEQKIKEERNRLEQVKLQANQTVVAAQAQADAARVLAEAASSKEGSAYLFLEYLKKWDGRLPTVMTDDQGGVILQLPPSS